MRLGEVLESPDRLVVPFWNWSSISVEGSDLDSRVVLNETGDTDVNCPDFVTVPYNFTVLLTAGCTVGVLVALYILFRAYRLLFITYCVSLSRQTDEAVRVSGDRVVLRLPGRLRSSHQAKTDSPPPPYDSPPPYHVAVVMRTEGADPPPPPDIEMTSSVYI